MTALDLSAAQLEIFNRIVAWYAGDGPPAARETYLAGYAGTGKTTMAAALIAHLEDQGQNVLAAAYTGKAAGVLRRRGIAASTIHSLIYEPIPGSDPVRFQRADDSALSAADLLVIDEVSMVGEDLATDLRSYGVKILVLGDPGQLPPVRGGGAFTNREPDAFLTEIHRQARGSPILQLATRVRLGEALPPIGEWGNLETGVRIGKTVWDEIENAEGQLICGTHRARWGITRRLRALRVGVEGDWRPTADEPVICCRNDHARGLYNGQIGRIVEVVDDGGNDDYDRPFLRIELEDGPTIETKVESIPLREHYEGKLRPPYYERGVQLFDYAYAITCHKAQGSEWPVVTVVDDSAAFGADRNRWLYTAVTRASEKLVLLRRDL